MLVERRTARSRPGPVFPSGKLREPMTRPRPAVRAKRETARSA